MTDLLREITAFRSWAALYPMQSRSGEWECDYPNWTPLYMAVLKFIGERPYEGWTHEEREAVLYAIARDNETEYLAHEIRVDHPETLLRLTEFAIQNGERDTKWQLAAELGTFEQSGEEIERLLLGLAEDKDEYVRRRTLSSLARLGSAAVEELALAAWNTPVADQQYARMNALWSLNRIGSPLLGRLLAEAEKDERPYLSDYAKRVRDGRIES